MPPRALTGSQQDRRGKDDPEDGQREHLDALQHREQPAQAWDTACRDSVVLLSVAVTVPTAAAGRPGNR